MSVQYILLARKQFHDDGIARDDGPRHWTGEGHLCECIAR